jgi:hypothetical protein
LQGENRFSKEIATIFGRAINKMSLAKNIRLAEGTIGVWEECVIEDIRDGVFDLEDFIEATKRVIREPVYNRIDYADIYGKATDICRHRRMLFKVEPNSKYPISPEFKKMVASIGKEH